MVVSKSKSHPDLVFYSSPRWNTDHKVNGRDNGSDSDSESSELDVLKCLRKADNANDSTATSSNATATSAIGSLLWKLLLTKQLPVQISSHNSTAIWQDLKKQYPSLLSNVSEKELQEYHTALTSIVIMDEAIDPRAASILQDYNGRLMDISASMTHELLQQCPPRFTALVADFNDNMGYARESTRGIPCQTGNPKTMEPEDWETEVKQLETAMKNSTTTPNDDMELQGSFLKTEHETIPQPAHVDYPWQLLEQSSHNLWLAFFALTGSGMMLQVWPSCDGERQQGQLVYIPLGKLLITPSNMIHGGGFRTAGGNGNIRYHLYLATGDATSLPRFANNVYTLPQNKRIELSDVCVNAPGLDDDRSLLMELLFE